MSPALNLTTDQICKRRSSTLLMWFNALKVRCNDSDELNAAVDDGSMNFNLALGLRVFDHLGHRLILAELPRIKPRQRANFVELVRLASLQEQEV